MIPIPIIVHPRAALLCHHRRLMGLHLNSSQIHLLVGRRQCLKYICGSAQSGSPRLRFLVIRPPAWEKLKPGWKNNSRWRRTRIEDIVDDAGHIVQSFTVNLTGSNIYNPTVVHSPFALPWACLGFATCVGALPGISYHSDSSVDESIS
jgi:hypothetical protein